VKAVRAVVIGAAVVLLGVIVGRAVSQEEKPQKPGEPGAMDPKAMEEMMKEYMRLSTPGEPHKLLTKLAGSWTTSTRIWMDPTQPPSESSGKCSGKLTFGGRFVLGECEGTMMGQPTRSLMILGHDNFKKVFEMAVIVDNSTSLLTSTGTLDESGKVLTLRGTMEDPFAGKRAVRNVIRIESDDKHVFEAYDTLPDGKEFKVIEGVYTRVK